MGGYLPREAIYERGDAGLAVPDRAVECSGDTSIASLVDLHEK